MDVRQYLSRPYARRLTPDVSGGYVATIQEFPGLVAEGETADEALTNLEAVAADWIAAALDAGKSIPDPVELGGFSGKIALRLPRGLHKRAAEMASMEGSSLNQWLSVAIAYYLGNHDGMRAAMNRLLINIDVKPTASNYYSANLVGSNYYVQNLTLGSNVPSTGVLRPSYIVPQDLFRSKQLVSDTGHDNG